MLNRLFNRGAMMLAGAIAIAPVAAHADVTVLMSGGFALAYRELLPEFERTSGVRVATLSGASQGNGPSTIKAQLQRGTHADVVILSKEGVDDLNAAGLIVPGSETGLATTPLGAAVRAGAPKPDIATVAALRDSLLKARLISMPGSTSGKFIKDKVLPKLGIADRAHVKVVARGVESTAMLAAGESDIALGPVSELVRQLGVDFAGRLPEEVQLVQQFTAAIVKGTRQESEVQKLVAFLSSDKATAAIRKAGMEPVVPAAVVKDLAPQGKLRAAINFGNPVLAQKDAAGGAPHGISADLSRELARRLGVPVEFVPFESAGKVADAARAGVWDIAFLAVDPKRANDIAFTAPYVVIEGSYLVPAESPLRTIADVDRPGVRIAVGKGSAYDLFLTRTIRQARIVRAPTSPTVIDVFRDQHLEAAAGVRQQLIAFAAQQPGVRVMDGRFMAIEQAVGTPKGREHALAFLKTFVEDAKASGFVADALARSQQGDVAVAPPVQ